MAHLTNPARASRTEGAHTFKRDKRIRKSQEFSQVQQKGKRFTSKHFLFLVSKNKGLKSRIGITITRKVDSRAVYRNRLKRRLRELFRIFYGEFLAPFDIVIIARKNAAECEMGEIRREVLGTLKHAGLLKRSSGDKRNT